MTTATDSMSICRDCGKKFRLQPLLDLPHPTRCMECLIGLEARYSREVSERRALDAALSRKVGMGREFEELLGCGDTYADVAFETGLARLKALLAAEANGLALANRAFAAESELARELARRVAAEADVDRLTRVHADCEATIRTLAAKALTAVRGYEAAEARCALMEKECAEIMASDLPYAQATRKARENFDLFDRQRTLAIEANRQREAAEARCAELEADVAFLAPRAFKDGEWYADEDRDFGLSANNLVNVAYGAKDAGDRPCDRWDLRACELAYSRLPVHRMTEPVRLLLVECRRALEVK